MVDDGRSHYDVLGIEHSADKEQIRAAYQERLDELRAEQTSQQDAQKPNEGAIAASRDEEARLRSAWQVLSDPYQRGRYDATMELGPPAGDEDAYDEPEPTVDGRALSPREERARERSRQRAEAMANRPPGMFSPVPSDKPSTWPANVTPPPPRARSIAMIIDLFVLYLILTVGGFVVAPAILDEAYPKQSKELDRITDCRTRLDNEDQRDRTSLARLERVEQSADCAAVRVKGGYATSVEKPATRLEKDINRVEDRNDKLLRKVQPVSIGISFGMMFIMLLYLIPSSVISGRTLGKRFMQVRVVNEDGSRLRAGAAIRRFGLPVVVGFLLSNLGLGPLGFVVVLFVVLNWPRNPNLQGMHDRFARTIVVDG